MGINVNVGFMIIDTDLCDHSLYNIHCLETVMIVNSYNLIVTS